MREYEAMVITKPDLPESEFTKMAARWESILGTGGGQIIRKDSWGARKLAHPINKTNRGVYTVWDVAATPEAVHEFERIIKLDENVLRGMVVKLADRVNVEQRKIELQKQAEEAAARAAEAARERAESDGFSARRGGSSHDET